MELRTLLVFLLLFSAGLESYGVGPTKKQKSLKSPWNMEQLSKAPKTFDTDEFKADGNIRPIFYEGLKFKGKDTKVFAWYGCPDVKPGMKVPGIVLVHGGNGTAVKKWVKLWVARGYAAIAMDLNGQMPKTANAVPIPKPYTRSHKWPGPYNKNFGDIGEPVGDQWMYHAVADVILANSLLRSFKEVDSKRIGFMGISWGGIILSNAAGVDNRFAFGVIVYGCGYLFEAGNHYQNVYYKNMIASNALKCQKLWDGSSYLADSKMPLLWINSTNDNHFPMFIFQKSYLLTKDHARLCFIPGYRHDYSLPWSTKQIYAFADSICKQDKPLVKIINQSVDNQTITALYSKENKPIRAYLHYTTDKGSWAKRKWQKNQAEIISHDRLVKARVPKEATVFFLNLHGANGIVSSNYFQNK
jgi:dienelactone hydrolase